MSEPILHHHSIGASSAEKRMFVLHGIYGAGRNWATFARRLTEARPDWALNLVDLRQHGHSRGFAPPHTLAACVHDLNELADSLGVRVAAVLGHSFGGKVALMSAMALRPRQVWVIDSTPSRRSPGGSAYRMLRALRSLPEAFDDRTSAAEALEAEGFAPHVGHWMATNLELTGGRYRWRFDADDMEALLDDFFRRDLWDIVLEPPDGIAIHMVRASESDVMSEDDVARAGESEHPCVSVHELHGGHWLHQDNLDGLLELVADRLP